MNDTNQLIEKLANKLGTTAESLWSILLRQAPIDATINLIHLIAAISLAFFLWKAHLRLLKKPTDDKYSDSCYEKYEIAAILPMLFGLIFVAGYLIAMIGCIQDIINGYFNPEYWALNKVLSQIK